MQEIFNLTPGETWFGKPQEINKKISEWKTNWADIVRVDEEIQFSGDKVYAITVTDREYEYFEDFGENIPSLEYEVSYMQAQLWEMSIAVEYLKRAHIGEIAPIEESINRGEEFLANNGFEQLVKHPLRKKDSGFKER